MNYCCRLLISSEFCFKACALVRFTNVLTTTTTTTLDVRLVQKHRLQDVFAAVGKFHKICPKTVRNIWKKQRYRFFSKHGVEMSWYQWETTSRAPVDLIVRVFRCRRPAAPEVSLWLSSRLLHRHSRPTQNRTAAACLPTQTARGGYLRLLIE